ncbi:DUF2062 domain-containing protein [Anianabacter salinae]|uniref:DUF2062 domain-containing protein n=1 Tax=Anianabacter salinae TaxID=2851023 RepID=UPI00225DDEE1|nr:DUF2062 domain-containing protein [Anianabacter salinae]MBV0913268.1 DUF2062 domain-containing protein [Anianabacter salinae]
MVFKRRKQRTWVQKLGDLFWPKGGWGRAASYIMHRLRRLPDPPHKIARGIAAGVFVSFSPFFGFHFVYAALVALIIQGNMLAALMATFVGNPLTFPIIATISLEIGTFLLDSPNPLHIHNVVFAFSRAALDLWQNLIALFTDRDADWTSLAIFYRNVFLPYLVGGFFPGVITGYIFFRISVPMVTAYQKIRDKKRREKVEKRRLAKLKAEADLAAKAD